MRRRQVLSLIAGAAASPVLWPLAAGAQQGERIRRLGVLMNSAEHDPDSQVRIAALLQRLNALGWSEGRNLRLDIRWGAGDMERVRRFAKELVALSPDVTFVNASAIVAALQQETRTIPIVFTAVIDPVGAGLVASMARPGGNTTGFLAFEYAIGAKWLELLKEIAPGVTRAAVLRDASIAAGIGQFAAIQATGAIGMDLSVIGMQDGPTIEQAVAEFVRDGKGGLVVTGGPFATNHPALIATLAARYKLPAVYPFRYFVEAGGLVSYGPDLKSQFRAAAGYVDGILRGEKPANLPVQAPTKYELVINLKAAKTLGIEVPATLLARADEVIE
jgi:putative ABC transport system substrate-binding protein